MNYGFQLCSMNNVAKDNMDEALRLVAEMGYKSIEFAGFFGVPALDLLAMLIKHGLTVSGSHTSCREVFENFNDTIAYHKTLGNNLIIFPGADLSDQSKLDVFITKVNELQLRTESAGIRFGYHNHTHEFSPNNDGSIICEQLISRTNIALEIDTFWAFAGGNDPVALMEKYKDRLVAIHLKDGTAEGDGTALGKGEAPVKAVYKKAIELGTEIVVECETYTPGGHAAKACMEYIRFLEKNFHA